MRHLLRIAVSVLILGPCGPLVAAPLIIKDKAINVDGSLSDWVDIAPAVEDSTGDAYSEAPDLQTVKLATMYPTGPRRPTNGTMPTVR